MTTKPIKLSAAERKLLRECCYTPKYVPPHTMAAKRLISKELVTRLSPEGVLFPTPEGRRVNELSE